MNLNKKKIKKVNYFQLPSSIKSLPYLQNNKKIYILFFSFFFFFLFSPFLLKKKKKLFLYIKINIIFYIFN